MANPKLFTFTTTLFSLFLLTLSSKLTIPISPFPHHSPSSDLLETLSLHAAATVSRAHHLKNRHLPAASSATNAPLFPRSYGGYSVSLRFGTPPQTSSFVMDTGSSLVWFPCTKRYTCSKCNFPNSDPSKIQTFLPKNSSTTKIIGCRNPKCSWVLGPDVISNCPNCNNDPGSKNCSQSACPTYIIQYGSGTTIGILISETLDFPEKTVPDFLVGCSVFSIRQPAGIAGFGRGPESLPAQMGLSKFSYCLVSHKFDDNPQSSDLVLYSSSSSGESAIDSGERNKTEAHMFTPFQKNPGQPDSAFREYYYIALRKVIVGKKHVKIPYKFLVPGAAGSGGTIVDSGSTFTFMENPVFEPVASEFESQMANYTRALKFENMTGLRPCFDISKEKEIEFPELVFQFKGGAKMELPLPNYFSFISSSGIVCLTIVTDGVVSPGGNGGPAIILGNYQQQNFHIEYDLENERFGFRKQSCVK